MRTNFHENHIVARALVPTSIAAAGTANGTTITRPGLRGRQLTFILTAAANVGVTVLTFGVQYFKAGGWTTLKDNAGNAILFTAAKTLPAGEITTDVLLGTVPLDWTDDGDYRITVNTVTGATALVAVVAVISDLYTIPSSEVDDLLERILPA